MDAQISAVLSVQFSPDGRRVAWLSSDDVVRQWRVEESGGSLRGGWAAPAFRAQGFGTRRAVYTPDGAALALLSAHDSRLGLFHSHNAACTMHIHIGTPSPTLHSVTFAPSLSTGVLNVLVVTGERILRMWNVTDSLKMQTFRGHKSAVLCTAVSADLQRLYSGAFDGGVHVWSVHSGECLQVLDGHHGGARDLDLSPDMQRLAVACGDGSVALWHTVGTRRIAQLRVHRGATLSVRFDCLGHNIVTGGADGMVLILDSNAGLSPLATLLGHAGSVFSVDISPDARLIVSGSHDGTVRFWRNRFAFAMACNRTASSPPNAAPTQYQELVLDARGDGNERLTTVVVPQSHAICGAAAATANEYGSGADIEQRALVALRRRRRGAVREELSSSDDDMDAVVGRTAQILAPAAFAVNKDVAEGGGALVPHRTAATGSMVVVPNGDVSDLRCALCFEAYDSFGRIPMVNSVCGHTFVCQACSYQLRLQNAEPVCPLCRCSLLEAAPNYELRGVIAANAAASSADNRLTRASPPPAHGHNGMADGAMLAMASLELDARSLEWVSTQNRLVGQGFHGTVYRALLDGTMVAVKELREDLPGIHVLAPVVQLRHHHLVQLYGVCRRPKLIVSEFMAGGSLRGALAELRSKPFDVKLCIATHIAQGMAYLHGRGEAHGHLCAENVLLSDPLREWTPRSRVKLSDAGLARAFAVGGVYAVAKEQQQADVYALGVLLAELFRCTSAWQGVPSCELRGAVSREGPRPPSPLHVNEVPEPVALLVQQCWNVRPEQRPSAALIMNTLSSLPTAPHHCLLELSALSLDEAGSADELSRWRRTPAQEPA